MIFNGKSIIKSILDFKIKIINKKRVLGNSAGGFINSDHITSLNFLLIKGFNHLGSEVIFGFHFGSFQGDFTTFIPI